MGANPYEGMKWNGHRWMAEDPETGEMVEQKLTIWQKSRPWEKAFMLTLFGGTCLAIGILTGTLPWPF